MFGKLNCLSVIAFVLSKTVNLILTFISVLYLIYVIRLIFRCFFKNVILISQCWICAVQGLQKHADQPFQA